MRETVIEQHLVDGAAKAGGWALKLVCPGNAGVPDRLVVLPVHECPTCRRSASIGLIELKAPGQELRPLQVRQIERLARLGVPTGWADSHLGVDAWLAALGARGARS